MSSQKNSNHSNTLQKQFSVLSVMDPIREDNINILYIYRHIYNNITCLYYNMLEYNMFVTQGMNKKQSCDHLKIRPVKLIIFEKVVTYKLHITLFKGEKA